jgi:Ni/Co efflux regulator RcnB
MPIALEMRQGGPMMNRIVSSALAAAMALSMAGAAQAATEMKPKKEPTAAQLAARERMTKCSAEWKDAKAGGKLAKDAKWPRFWSECNARLKGGMKA